MKQTVKRIACLLACLCLVLQLFGCGSREISAPSGGFSPASLRGIYREANGSGFLALGEDKMALKNEYGVRKGSYKVDGNVLTFTYTWDGEDMPAETDTVKILLIWDEDRLILSVNSEGITYVREEDSGVSGFDQILRIIGIVAVVLVLLAVFVILPLIFILKRGRRKKKDRHPAKKTMPARIFERKKAIHTQKKILISPDTCCICGGSLSGGAVTLNGLRSDREAWIDQRCLKKLQAMSQGENDKEFEQAARYMREQTEFVEPEVAEALDRFIKKCTAQTSSAQNETAEP